MSGSRVIGAAIVCLVSCWSVVRYGAMVHADEGARVEDPNAACAPCHEEIYDRYRKTPMANASGLAAEGLIPADFTHQASGVHYQIYKQGAQAWLSYERDNPSRELKGHEELRYFLGSGTRGRTYLFERQGYWFESPINWYAKKKIWDMTPNYLEARQAPLTLPVDPGCLHCHASGVAKGLPDARNHYADVPFADGGITCAACHGNGRAHIASGGKTRMIDIDHLEPVRRDSVCLRCHLEGNVAVVREGKALGDYEPGDNLFDYILFFAYRGEHGSGGRATSQLEALEKSECKQRSGDRLTCTTCHDPHGSPDPEEKVGYYRRRCLQCHAALETRHHPENPDCTACHMGRPPSNDIAHEQVTDHWIRKQVTGERLPLVTTGPLEIVGGVAAGDRDLGLAYAQMAARGDRKAADRATQMLQRAEKEAGGAWHDHELHAQLGFLEQVNGHMEEAAVEYRRALDADAHDSLAGGNLALLEAQQHRYGEAARLWNLVFEYDPVEVGAGLNLAVVECGEGEREHARRTLDRLLSFAPDNDQARTMVEEIQNDGEKCRPARAAASR